MIEYLFKSVRFNEVIEFLCRRPRILSFDFDGTLAPIAASPEEVVISAGLPVLLEKLTLSGDTVVALVSGRSISGLRKFIDIDSIIYFGNHGITSSVEGLGADKRQLLEWTDKAHSIYKKISASPEIFKGCYIENKGPVISVHFRKVSKSQTEELLARVSRIAEESGVIIQYGKMVADLKPRTVFSKGTALCEIASKRFYGWKKGDTFLFTGDDITDEDGFRTIKSLGAKAFGLKIGDGETLADFRLFNGEIERLIKIILQEEL